MSQIGVIGSTGLVGRSIADILTREFQNSVVRFCKSSFSSQNLHDGHLVQLDILNLRQSLNLLEGFNTVFFCNGYTGHDYSSDDASRYFRSETELIKKLLKLDKRIIYFSSNKVELLKSSPVISLPPGLHRYLKHKRNMEDILLGYTNQTTIRLGKVIHEAYPRYKSWIESCGKLQSISVPENIYYEPIDIQDISNKVIRLFQAGLSGMHILQSSDSISYFHSANIVSTTI
jgi:nucleoside-diphosphate-sugar epimerase